MKPTKAIEIQKAIADDIVHGRRPPGTSLDEVTLARDFNVSRTPIREAIRQLEMSGLVQARPHRGAIVCDVSKAERDDMFRVMTEIEAICARWAAAAMTTDERTMLRRIHESSATALEREDREAYAEHNLRLHDAIYDGAHNSFLADIARHVRLRLAPFRRAQFERPGRLKESYAEHDRLVAAIERADPGPAETAMRDHMALVRDAIEETTSDTRRRAGQASA